MKYKAGDCVIIKPDLEVGKTYGEYNVWFCKDMYDYVGTIQTILRVWDFGASGGRYSLRDVGSFWVDEMILCKIPFSENIILGNHGGSI